MPTVSIICVTGTSWADKVVRFVERHEPHTGAPEPLSTHTALCIGHWGIEAVPPRVQTLWLPHYATPYRRYDIPITQDQMCALFGAMMESIGEPYSRRALLAAGWYCLTGRYSRFLDDKGARCDCSMKVALLLRGIGVECCPGVHASNVTPLGVEMAVRAMGYREVRYAE